MPRIGILEGSLRKASLSRAIARNAAQLAPEGMSVVTLPSTDTLPHFNQDVLDRGLPDAVADYAAALAEVDALLVVTPEYNWSIPGTLKNAIDWISRLKPNPLEGMPAAIWSVSPGMLGGARVHEGLRHVLLSQGMQVMAKPEVQVALAKTRIDSASGRITHEETAKFLGAHLAAFDVFARRWAGTSYPEN
ncbi:NADPH-dependent FMN reductase [Frigidibacter sp. ROC022]|uniref:NADPH-dependent FMN reductase n=1 Tax=Frigidibacter sp. ROC022 TaxID=2971796 RepID=UPI00215A7CBB|nr:NADPH-dependent FMN reductase [Frigidibacter sp. ROC022]MCR8724651.1 NAD(P)H-dependent oxidoreductase [Frigidibacter sp. ROC022]